MLGTTLNVLGSTESDVLGCTLDVLGSASGGERQTILMASLLSGQIPFFLNPEMIVSGRIALYQACENKELLCNYRPRILCQVCMTHCQRNSHQGVEQHVLC